MKRKSLIILLVVLLFSGCQYFSLMTNREWKEKNDKNEIDIYVAGHFNSLPCYWKNGE